MAQPKEYGNLAGAETFGDLKVLKIFSVNLIYFKPYELDSTSATDYSAS